MNPFFLFLLLFAGCSVSNLYKTSDIEAELKKNATQLHTIAKSVHNDYQDKKVFLQTYKKQVNDKNNYILQDLTWRLHELKIKHDEILTQSSTLMQKNNELLSQIKNKEVIKESDPVYEKVDTFGKQTDEEAADLFHDYSIYKNASTDFARFALFTGNIWKR